MKKTRWQKSLEAAVAAYDTPLPWERGAPRDGMILRRERKVADSKKEPVVEGRRA